MLAGVFSEIILKGKNRPFFQKKLLRNIERVLGKKPKIKESFVILEEGDALLLRDVLGLDYVYIMEKLPLDLDALFDRIVKENLSVPFKVEVKRSYKEYPLNSWEISRELHKRLAQKGFSCSFKNPVQRVFVYVFKDGFYVSFKRLSGWGGLPVGSSGRVLSLLSGGIDSPVASWLMMKRGCAVDFFHVFDQAGDKPLKLARLLKRYHPPRSFLYLAPYEEFYKASFSIEPKYELVVFRRFILRVAERLAGKHKALVTGDSLGQVASQTLENLAVTNAAVSSLVLRPLIGFNKKEIIELSQKLGLYETSIQPYKDCCSLVAHKRPSTRASLEKIEDIEREISVEEVVKRTLSKVNRILI